MKTIIPSLVLIILTVGLSAQDCYLQVKAEPNIRVFLNDEYKGITNVEFSGLIIEKLKAGTYNIRVDKEYYSPQTETIILNPGEVKIYQVKPFIPKYKITQSGNKQQQTIELKTGSLKIQSLPVEILIEISELNIKSTKSNDEWNIEDIPIGLYKIKFIWNNKVLFDTIRIDQNRFKHIFANLVNGNVEIRSNNMYQEHKRTDYLSDTSAEEKNISAETEKLNDRTKSAISISRYVSTTQVPTETFSKNGTSYNLQGRGVHSLPAPKYDSQGEGRVVVEISVDRDGKVIQAIPGVKGSTTLDENLLRVSKEAAMQSQFEQRTDAPVVQKGMITYTFMMK